MLISSNQSLPFQMNIDPMSQTTIQQQRFKKTSSVVFIKCSHKVILKFDVMLLSRLN